jgi:hypothetical protein
LGFSNELITHFKWCAQTLVIGPDFVDSLEQWVISFGNDNQLVLPVAFSVHTTVIAVLVVPVVISEHFNELLCGHWFSYWFRAPYEAPTLARSAKLSNEIHCFDYLD